MKKIYLSMIAIVLASSTFAQSDVQNANPKKVNSLFRTTNDVSCGNLRLDSTISYVDEIEYFRTYSFYDNSGNETYELTLSSLAEISLILDSTAYQYDSKSRVIEEITFDYDSDLEDYLYSSKVTYSYDDENSITIEESFEWTEDGNWLPEQKYEFSTNNDGDERSIEISMDFDLETNKYTHIQTFGDVFNLPAKDSVMSVIDDGSVITNYYHLAYYNEASYPIKEEVYQIVEGFGGLLVSKDTFELNDQNLTIREKNYDVLDEEFTLYSESILEYNSCGEVISLVTNYYDEGVFSLANSTDFFYSEKEISGVNRSEKANFVFYPNPVQNSIYLETKVTYMISSLQGEVLLQGIDNNIDVSDLNSGIYMIGINGSAKRFVKE